LPYSFQGLGRVQEQGDSCKIVLLEPINVFRSNEVELILDAIGIELEDRGIILDDLFVELVRGDIDNVDICLDGSEYSCNLVVFPLLEVLHG
jgi:hypothetical protein